jgi:hypothetical protein
MPLPTWEALDEMAGAIVPGLTFDKLGPESRVQVMTLALAAEKVEALEVIGDNLKNIETAVDNIDTRLIAVFGDGDDEGPIEKHLAEIANQLGHVGHWFDLSKLYEGR